MKNAIRGIGLGLFLMAGCATILLISDLNRRKQPTAQTPDPETMASAAQVTGAALPNAAAAKEPAQRAGLAKKRIMRMINYSDATHMDSIVAGVRAGIEEQDWQPENYVLRVSNAQGDMAALVGIIEAAIDEKPDVLLVTSTPALQAVMQRVPPNQPVIFGAVGAPVAAGAGKSYTEHLTNVTGISSESDFAGMAKVVKKCFPNARAVGTLFTPTEINSVLYKESFEKELNKLGISLVARAVYMPGEVPAAADALAQTDVVAICQIMDNLTAAAFPAIVGAARRQHMPLFSFMSDQVATGGAILAVARDYEQAGRDMVELAALLFQGHSLGTIPFRLISKTILCLNPKNLEYCPLQMPAEIMDSAIIVKDSK